jgi:hypothetical protein
MKRKLLFTFIVALLLFPCTVAYAYDSAAASTSDGAISTADTASLPKFNIYGNAVGSVTPGDIFIIDNTGRESAASFTLYLTNADELIHNFRYMTLNIGIYSPAKTGEWLKVPVPESIYLTMQNAISCFSLDGSAKYKITIEKGCFYCYATGSEKTVALPEFYLTTN